MKNISPNVTIYKFPICAISSITNRVTGLAVTGFFIVGGLSCLANYDLIEQYNKLNSNVQNIVNYSMIFPITYHTFGGIRHFMWDKYPSLLETTKVSKSSGILLLSCIGSTVYINNCIKTYEPFNRKKIPPILIEDNEDD